VISWLSMERDTRSTAVGCPCWSRYPNDRSPPMGRRLPESERFRLLRMPGSQKLL